ncbi:hypothetical protein COCON_G00107960 [Conger conger]|uniref:Heat shock factor binding protein 1 n=1 Tax=Conger conger TaxID=82655 RepID=A0A9Q1DJ21_CONCO|nr:hypothetical protein COCON_G00107960 [Conger conger]
MLYIYRPWSGAMVVWVGVRDVSSLQGIMGKPPLSLTEILDEMSTRIDDLEKNIADLMTQAGVEETEGESTVKEVKGRREGSL